ncbi:hypothetical protein [Acidithiobacillus ferrooxidans]|uniref:hypothetical protein n=1 Tax=Acidithiobacillus ferrooxidans TaxID=920 RepID=UPI001EF212F1|nr:hypothetical protein [Acidithiobacillus ferrooxidans]
MFEPSVTVPISYCAEWMDGYGARGWKIDMTVDDPEIIASTSETGLHIPTSVLIHDILDHYLCGLPPSGHRNEAIALHQLALRTGADPLPDLAQMVDEDLIHGHVLGETMHTFLPENLRRQLPEELAEGQAIAHYLLSILGQEAFRELLIKRLVELGQDSAAQARAHYQSSGLQYNQRALCASTCRYPSTSNPFIPLSTVDQSIQPPVRYGAFLWRSGVISFGVTV